MSEEEKKTFKFLKTFVKTKIDYCKLEKSDVLDILNIIEKQQKEIDEWQKAYIRENNYWLKFRNKINKIANNDKDCSDNKVIKAVKNLNKENDKLTKLLLGKSLGFNDYISKKKIREKQEQLMKIGWNNKEERHKQNFAYDILKELLEE